MSERERDAYLRTDRGACAFEKFKQNANTIILLFAIEFWLEVNEIQGVPYQFRIYRTACILPVELQRLCSLWQEQRQERP